MRAKKTFDVVAFTVLESHKQHQYKCGKSQCERGRPVRSRRSEPIDTEHAAGKDEHEDHEKPGSNIREAVAESICGKIVKNLHNRFHRILETFRYE